MKRVHVAATLLEAQLAADTLAAVGITTHILNAHAAGALGDLPFLHAQPELWVDDDAQTERARTVLATIRDAPASVEKPCPRCGKPNPGHFLSCWHCGGGLAD
jgi:hypothetical protein